MLLALLVAAVGCKTSSTAPGDLKRIQPASPERRLGNAYLFRGWIGIFSTGIDELGGELEKMGTRATVYQDDQWEEVAATIAQQYGKPGTMREPLILIGHSLGADDCIRVSRYLKDHNVRVDLVVVLDPVKPPLVPNNITRTVDLYQSHGLLDALPAFRGVPLEQEEPGKFTLVNSDIRKDRKDLLTPDLDHFNIEKKPDIHLEIMKEVARVSRPRNRTKDPLQ